MPVEASKQPSNARSYDALCRCSLDLDGHTLPAGRIGLIAMPPVIPGLADLQREVAFVNRLNRDLAHVQHAVVDANTAAALAKFGQNLGSAQRAAATAFSGPAWIDVGNAAAAQVSAASAALPDLARVGAEFQRVAADLAAASSALPDLGLLYEQVAQRGALAVTEGWIAAELDSAAASPGLSAAQISLYAVAVWLIVYSAMIAVVAGNYEVAEAVSTLTGVNPIMIATAASTLAIAALRKIQEPS